MPLATKPVLVPRWANVTSGVTVEPTELKKDSGFAPGEHPPAEYWNWLMLVLYTWVLWLKDLQDEVLTWTAHNTFTDGVTVTTAISDGNGTASTGLGTGAGVLGIGGSSDGIGVSGQGVAAGPGVQGLGGTAGPGVLGLGGGTNQDGVIGVGASGGAGGRFTAGSGAIGVQGTGKGVGAGVRGDGGTTSGIGVYGVGGGTGAGVRGDGGATGIGVLGQSTSANPAVKGIGAANGAQGVVGIGGLGATGVSGTGGNDGNGVVGTGTGGGSGVVCSGGVTAGALALDVGTGSAQFNGAQPASNANVAHDNFLCATNICKAWAVISFASGTPTIVDGYNVSNTITTVTAGLTYQLNFVRPFASTSYCPTHAIKCSGVAGVTPLPEFPILTPVSGSILGINFMSDATTQKNISVTTFTLFVQVMGRQ